MSEFKVGDKVVVTSIRGEFSSPMRVHKRKTYTIQKIRDEKVWVTEEEVGSFFFEDELTLESIYNSPLYKALS